MTNENTIAEFKIVGGPSRGDMFLSLELCDEDREVTFEIEEPMGNLGIGLLSTQAVLVDDIGIPDRGMDGVVGEDWKLRLSTPSPGLFGGVGFGAFYNTQNRRGRIWSVQKTNALTA